MLLKKAWSYSALTAFETCPRRYHLTRVTKKVREPQNPAQAEGNRQHKALEKYAKGEAKLPDQYDKYRRYVDKLFAREGQRIVEKQMCINIDMQPTGWFDKDAWCRGIVDIGVINSDTAYLLDWKTGKRKFDIDQLELFAALASLHYPWVEKFITGFVWLKVGKFDRGQFTKDDMPGIWAGFNSRLQRLAIAYDKDKWVPRPSGLCRDWCPVGKKHCEYCGG